MNDTPPEITEMVNDIIRRKTPEERARMGWSMYLTSRYLVTRAILEENPGISEGGLRRELFLRFYGDEFDLETRDKIAAHLENVI